MPESVTGRCGYFEQENLVRIVKYGYNRKRESGHGAARLARLHGVQEVLGSNPSAPTEKGNNKKGQKTLDKVERKNIIRV